MSGNRSSSATIEDLASRIASLTPGEQEALMDRVAELNFQKGLDALAARYRERLRSQKRLDQAAHEVLSELRQLRERIAADEYRL